MAASFTSKDWKKIGVIVLSGAIISISTWAINTVWCASSKINNSRERITALENCLKSISEKVANNSENNKINTKEVIAIKIGFASQSTKLDNISKTVEKGNSRMVKRLDDMYNIILQLKRTDNVDYTPSSDKNAICLKD
jgi:hypothetical protein